VLGASFSADSARIVTASADLTARLWDATTGRDLNRAKFAVLQQIEADLPVALFTRERETYRRDRRRSLSSIERLIPGCFALLYTVMLIAAIVTRGS
jgi:WD40 repeat protein